MNDLPVPPTLPEFANLLAALHIGEGLRRDRIQDSLFLERISHKLCLIHEHQGGAAAFPHLSESILATSTEVWPLPDARKACATAFRIFDILVGHADSPDAFRLLRASHGILRSAMRRVVMDRKAGIPV